jgi:hypothetical protein
MSEDTKESLQVENTEPQKTPEEIFYPDKKEPEIAITNEPPKSEANDDKPKEAPVSTKEAPVSPKETPISDNTEKYELKLPEGSFLKQDAVEDVINFAKENGLSKDQAQKILDKESVLLKNQLDSQLKTYKTQVEQWAKDVKDDPEIGGNNFNESIELSKRGLHRIASPELIKLIDETGYGNHIELVRAFRKLEKMFADDKIIHPGAQAAKQKTAVEIMFGSKGDK